MSRANSHDDSVDILFTAFEPSGDAIAARLITVLRKRRPDVTIWALGGARMRDAGANLIEDTSRGAVMLLGAASQAWAHWQRVQRLKRWLSDHALAALVPVDSPAANWAICRAVRRTQPEARIIHLVAPQLWGWASWRVHKLRRLTDHVLCLFPFEPEWFNTRGVVATFVGHPVFDAQPHCQDRPAFLPEATIKLAMLPGSRRAEIRANWLTMFGAFSLLKQKHPALHAAVAAVDGSAMNLIRQLTPSFHGSGGLPSGLSLHAARTAEVLEWCDVALVVSGTAAFEVAAQHKPMVVLFNVHFLVWHLIGRWIIKARTFAMPNVIAESSGLARVVPELVPHFGDPAPVALELNRLIASRELARAQIQALERITEPFLDRRFTEQACETVLELVS